MAHSTIARRGIRAAVVAVAAAGALSVAAGCDEVSIPEPGEQEQQEQQEQQDGDGQDGEGEDGGDEGDGEQEDD